MGQATKNRQQRRLDTQRREAARRRARRRNGVLLVLGLAGVLALAWWVDRERRPEGGKAVVGAAAPAFSLPSTAGGTVSLDDLRGRKALLYFSEGVGCDPCWAQIVDIERERRRFEQLGLELVPVMPNGGPLASREAARFEIRTPILVDEFKEASAAYDVLGRGHHADLPGHSFILVDERGAVRWRKDYSTMYVSVDDLLGDISAGLKG